MNRVMLRRRLAVSESAAMVIAAGRRIEWARIPPVARIAILAEAAGALASLARLHAEVSHVDARAVAELVTDPADALAVLGRGRWLPSVHRPVFVHGSEGWRKRSTGKGLRVVRQASLFDGPDEGGET